MDKVKLNAIRFKNHVKRQKYAYIMATVATAAIALQQTNNNAFRKFLEEKGIDPTEYYCPEYYEELKNS